MVVLSSRSNGSERAAGINYPCPWIYKVIGGDVNGLHQAVDEVLENEPHETEPSHTSSGGRYHSLNVHVVVHSESFRLRLYERLRSHPEVKLVL